MATTLPEASTDNVEHRLWGGDDVEGDGERRLVFDVVHVELAPGKLPFRISFTLHSEKILPMKTKRSNLFLVLFVLRLNVPVNNFSVMSGRSQRFLGLTSIVGS